MHMQREHAYSVDKKTITLSRLPTAHPLRTYHPTPLYLSNEAAPSVYGYVVTCVWPDALMRYFMCVTPRHTTETYEPGVMHACCV